MKSKTIVFSAVLSALIFTGCQNNDLSAQNQSLKQQVSTLQQKISDLQQENTKLKEDNKNMHSLSSNTTEASADEITASIYTMEELSEMVDEFVVSVGSATPDINNSGNLDQFFSLKRKGDQIEHALENHENSLEDKYRKETLSRDEYKKMDREIEKLEDLIDSAQDRLEIAFEIDD